MPKPRIYNNPEWKEVGVKADIVKIYEIRYVGKFTRENIEHIAQTASNNWKKKNFDGTFQVSLIYPNNQPRDGRQTILGEPIDLFDSESYYDEAHTKYIEEPAFFKEFYMFVVRYPPLKIRV